MTALRPSQIWSSVMPFGHAPCASSLGITTPCWTPNSTDLISSSTIPTTDSTTMATPSWFHLETDEDMSLSSAAQPRNCGLSWNVASWCNMRPCKFGNFEHSLLVESKRVNRRLKCTSGVGFWPHSLYGSSRFQMRNILLVYKCSTSSSNLV